jgi:hypothetical protein
MKERVPFWGKGWRRKKCGRWGVRKRRGYEEERVVPAPRARKEEIKNEIPFFISARG